MTFNISWLKNTEGCCMCSMRLNSQYFVINIVNYSTNYHQTQPLKQLTLCMLGNVEAWQGLHFNLGLNEIYVWFLLHANKI